MNRLMTVIHGGRLFMAEAAGGDGGDNPPPASTPTPGSENNTPPAPASTPTPPAPPAPTAGDPKPGEPKPGESGDPKPSSTEPTSAAGKTLEGEPKPGEPNPATDGDPKPGEQKPTDGEPKQYTDEDFTKAIVTSDAVKKAAGDDKIQLSPELVKGMLPAIRKANLSPEQANDLANELAARQIAAAKAHYEERVADIKQMNDEAMKLFPDKTSWDSIGAGIKHFFKPGGAMFETIAHSELGSDPEFLAMMKWVGERVSKDSLAAAPGAGGEKSVSYEKALMG